jgi:serine/threonine-protein kinase HipA
MSDKYLSVRMHGTPVADLEQLETGRLRLKYLPGNTRALSLSLPVREEPYEDLACEAYFGGLLPESQEARNRLAARHQVSPRSTFGLLKAIGADCAGAVSLHEPDEPLQDGRSLPIEAEPISEAELAKHIRELPRKPLFMDVEGMRLSLAGAQDKAAICLVENQPAFPVHGTPTTHILKPAIEHLEGTVLNEYVCLTLARAIGLSVPQVEIREADGIPYLLIERYDRVVVDGKTISRIHQEDFCQALGVLSENKYQANGGPGVEASFGLTLRLDKPAVARVHLLRHMIFNVLVGNCDAHAKNFSILHPENKKPALAPAYDILSTIYYDTLNKKMAMKVGGEYLADKLFARQWQRFAGDAGLNFRLVGSTLQELGKTLSDAIGQERRATENKIVLDTLGVIQRNLESVLQRYTSSKAFLEEKSDKV